MTSRFDATGMLDHLFSTTTPGLGLQNSCKAVLPILLLMPITTNERSTLPEVHVLRISAGSTSSGFNPENAHDLSVNKELNELRMETGLTWEQIAKLFDVSRRAVHFWASGKPINSTNREKIHQVINAMKMVSRGSRSKNLDLLFTAKNSMIPFELLQQSRFDEFVRLLGRGSSTKKEMKKLNAEEREIRAPLKPEILLGSSSEPIPRKNGKVRTVKAKRV